MEVRARVGWLLGELGRAAELLPGGAMARELFRAVEAEWLSALKSRLDELEHADASVAERRPPSSAAGEPPGRTEETPAALLTDLLSRSMEQDAAGSRLDNYVRILRDLVPDEARILSALSDGTAYPMVHVANARALGQVTERVLDNVSSVGKAAGVMWPAAVPRYLTNMRVLGLIETGPEDPALGIKYEILETDSAVRRAIDLAKETKRTAKILRRTVRISELGRSLWAACMPEPDGPKS